MWRLYDDFLLLLGERFNRWPWWLLPNRELRTETSEGVECDPLTAMYCTLHHRLLDIGSYREAGRGLGLDDATIDAIAQASDLAGSYNAHVRADLVQALQLHERWAPEGRWHDPAFHRTAWPHQYDRPFRHGSTWRGIASVAWTKDRSRSTPSVARPAWRSRLIVRMPHPAAAIWISSGSGVLLPAASSSFSVGMSRPGCELFTELALAV